MENTVNYNLKKPSEADEVLISDLNQNADIIDTELNKLDTELNKLDTELNKLDTTVKSLESGKVDKIEGKGLSSNDFTAGYQNKINNTENTLTNHRTDNSIHVTSEDKERWDKVKSSQNFIRNGQFMVNQRAPYNIVNNSDKAIADGWIALSGTKVEKIDDGIRLISKSQGSYRQRLSQGLEPRDVELLRGKEITFSALIKTSNNDLEPIDISIYTWKGSPSAMNTPGNSLLNKVDVYSQGKFEKVSITFIIPTEHNAMCVKMLGYGIPILEIKDVKLEIGNVATEYQPKTYVEELRDCQRYYRETPFMVSGHITGEVASFGQSSKMMRIEPRTNVKSLNSGAVGKVDLLNGIGSGSPVDPSIIMSNVGISRVIVVLPENSTGIQGILIEDAEIY